MTNDHEYLSRELMVLRRVVAEALERKRRLGQYAVVWRGGRPVGLEPEDLGGVGDYGMAPSSSASSVPEPGSEGGCNDKGWK